MAFKDITMNKLLDLFKRKLPSEMSDAICRVALIKTPEERESFMRSLPDETLRKLLTFFTYLLLKVDILSKAKKLGIHVSDEIADFLGFSLTRKQRIHPVRTDTYG